MPKTETRFSEIRAQDGNLTGTVLRYGDVATIGGQPERFEPGAFGNVAALDVILNVQHERTRPIARTGGGLSLSDSPESLRMAAELPQTRDAADTLELVRTGVLRGLSVEFHAIRETFEHGVRVIQEAVLTGLGIVDRPAYAESTVEARAELRQDGDQLIGTFPFNQPLTTRDRGRTRKAQWTPDSWKFAIQDLNREISLHLGKFETATQLASRKGGTLRLELTKEELRMEADLNRSVSYANDFMENLEAGNVFYTLTPRQSIPPIERVPQPYIDIPEPGNESVNIRVFQDTVLHGFYIRRTGGLGTLQRRWQPWL